MDWHAWFEAYVGKRWYAFDAVPTGLKGVYIAVKYGCDAADVAVYNQFGAVSILTKQVVKVECINVGDYAPAM